jgi:hypothetical protein
VRLFARADDLRDGDYATSAAEVRKFARAYRDRNVYVAPNPTSYRGGARHASGDVTHWSYFLIDMDPVEEVYDAQAAVNHALLWLGEWIGRDFSLNQPIIIDSGRGAQAWIRLRDCPLVNAEDKSVPGWPRQMVRRVNSYWLKRLDEKLGVVCGCRVDTSTSDLPRLMRCPGTRNVKTGRKASFVVSTDRVFPGVAKLLVVGTPPQALTDPDQGEVVAGQTWQAVFAHLTRMAQTYLTQGQEEPGRHKVMWHTAKKFRELGVTRAEAARALRWANSLRGEDSELPLEQVEHALDTAYEG